jgi:hypothetical protein
MTRGAIKGFALVAPAVALFLLIGVMAGPLVSAVPAATSRTYAVDFAVADVFNVSRTVFVANTSFQLQAFGNHTIYLPNGTYNWTMVDYDHQTATGWFTVEGKPVWVSVAFEEGWLPIATPNVGFAPLYISQVIELFLAVSVIVCVMVFVTWTFRRSDEGRKP